MKLDPARSRISIFTYAEGLFSRLAHDLELAVRDPEGTLESNVCTLHVPVRAIQVVGAVKRGKVDPSILSISDRDAIERQLREDVFRGSSADLIARGTREGARARVDVTVPTGRAESSCSVDVVESTDEARARGAIDLSFRALAIPQVKGPLGAFRLSDRVHVTFDLVFTPAQ